MNASEVIIYFGIPTIMVIVAMVLVVATDRPKFEEIRNPAKSAKVTLISIFALFVGFA